jgi:hypothetical protein
MFKCTSAAFVKNILALNGILRHIFKKYTKTVTKETTLSEFMKISNYICTTFVKKALFLYPN